MCVFDARRQTYIHTYTYTQAVRSPSFRGPTLRASCMARRSGSYSGLEKLNVLGSQLVEGGQQEGSFEGACVHVCVRVCVCMFTCTFISLSIS